MIWENVSLHDLKLHEINWTNISKEDIKVIFLELNFHDQDYLHQLSIFQRMKLDTNWLSVLKILYDNYGARFFLVYFFDYFSTRSNKSPSWHRREGSIVIGAFFRYNVPQPINLLKYLLVVLEIWSVHYLICIVFKHIENVSDCFFPCRKWIFWSESVKTQ